MMAEDDIWQRLTAVFRDVFGDDEIEIHSGTTAEDIEDWDSLTNVQLLIAIEKEFDGMKFNTGEVANLENVGQMVTLIQERLASQ